ncbi:3-hydroxyacyl-[acyl-carrier-protein] dehydratase FabZ [Limihaloglobus sulfuriphilus]|uniref:3-hydroxyacyl-[acyl-carrier-protein] dehydratase FabZ n=1 Tax=Limihaloglobus sulfuriphilus TaxID=1851148 RepID=A0A1Q2MF51_9BACT|nr:3-hydroxyacyl-ACP dehydratase FabZ family protein [Limihaloglobus sulfuriphilus]AQQ70872.1 3-hydroxyacyl-[acyl-carrier-protein] dehydratase FabZ [Limihaloglobus sulfuriphilus]
MRWIWIDKFVDFQSGKSASAIKNVSLAEEHLHDHFPGFPVMPECLMVEAMAQTAGILVGEAGKFKEKVILAKVNKAQFFKYVRPGDQIRLDAEILSIAPEAASTSGRISCEGETVAEINLMFSHLDNNISGRKFPEENFVFTEMFEWLLRDYAASQNIAEQS